MKQAMHKPMLDHRPGDHPRAGWSLKGIHIVLKTQVSASSNDYVELQELMTATCKLYFGVNQVLIYFENIDYINYTD